MNGGISNNLLSHESSETLSLNRIILESRSKLLSGQIFKKQRLYCAWGHKMVTYFSWASVRDIADKITLCEICNQLSQEVNKWRNPTDESLIYYVILCFSGLIKGESCNKMQERQGKVHMRGPWCIFIWWSHWEIVFAAQDHLRDWTNKSWNVSVSKMVVLTYTKCHFWLIYGFLW